MENREGRQINKIFCVKESKIYSQFIHFESKIDDIINDRNNAN